MIDIHSPGERLAVEQDPHPVQVSSPASPDISPAASPPTSIIEVSGVGLELSLPCIHLDLEEDIASPQVLQASWNPLRRGSPVTIQDTRDVGAEKDDRIVLGSAGVEQRLSSAPAPAMDLPMLRRARATDYYPELRSIEEVPHLQTAAAAAPHVHSPPSLIPMDDRPEHLSSTEPQPPIEIQSPTPSPQS
jgi:hypothetical protein